MEETFQQWWSPLKAENSQLRILIYGHKDPRNGPTVVIL